MRACEKQLKVERNDESVRMAHSLNILKSAQYALINGGKVITLK